MATFAMLEQSHPGSWDVLVIDGSNVFQAVDAGLMAPLPADQIPIGYQLPEIAMSDNNASDDVMYAFAAKFGYNTISYNATKVDNADKNDMSKVWSDKYKDRIAICDCDLPVIGVAAMANGIETAQISSNNLPQIDETLAAMHANARLVSDVVSSQTPLATGEVDIVIAGYEWLTAVLTGDQPERTLTIPKQGGMRWTQPIEVLRASEGKIWLSSS